MSCVICKEILHDKETVQVKQRGLETLVKSSFLHDDGLAEVFRNAETIILHKDCRLEYTKISTKRKLTPKSRDPSGFSLKESNFFFAPVDSDDVRTDYIPEISGVEDNANIDFLHVDDNNMVKTEIINEAEIDKDNLSLTLYNTEEAVTSENIPKFEEMDTSEVKCDHTMIKQSTSPRPEGYVPANNTKSDPEGLPHCNSISELDQPPSSEPFPFKLVCFVCEKSISTSTSSRFIIGHVVLKESTQMKIVNSLRKYSEASPEYQVILKRIQDVDLVEMEGRYHARCYYKVQKGLLGCEISKKNCNKQRPHITKAMDIIRRHFNQQKRRHYSVLELLDLVDSSIVLRNFINNLKSTFRDKIHITKLGGKGPVLTILDDSCSNSLDESQDLFMRTKVKQKKRKVNKQTKKSQPKENKSDLVTVEKGGDILFDDESPPPHSPCEDIYEEQPDVEDKHMTCYICHSTNRSLDALGDYSDVYKRICGDVYPVDPEHTFLICWECRALLKNAQRLQNRARASQQILNSEMQLKCLSTMTMTSLPAALISYEPEHHEIEIELEGKDEDIKDKHFEQIPKETDDMQEDIQAREDVMEWDNCNSFDDLDNDDKIDLLPVKQPKTTENNEKTEITDKRAEGDVETKPCRAKRKKRSTTKIKRFKKYFQMFSDDEIDKKSENSDSDWEEPSQSWKKPKQTKPSSRKNEHEQTNEKKKCDISKFCLVENKKFDTKTQIDRVPIRPDEVEFWRERERNSKYFSQNRYKKCSTCIVRMNYNHKNLCHSKDNPFVCQICEVSCPTQQDLDLHLANHYYVYGCKICQHKCCNLNHMKWHLQQHMMTEYQCLLCGKKFGTENLFEEHYLELHRTSACDYCGKRFLLKIDLEKHIQRKHEIVCRTCNKNFKKQGSLKRHMELKHYISMSENSYCVECDKQFNNEKHLQYHLNNSRKHVNTWKRPPPKPQPKQVNKCLECPKAFSKKYRLQNHYDFEHAKKFKFRCEPCDKAFVDGTSYRDHVRIRHEGYKVPKNKFCDYCGRGFSSNKILTHHIRTHTGERPHACPHCDARFAQRYAMLTHVKHIHEKAPRNTISSAPPSDQ